MRGRKCHAFLTAAVTFVLVWIGGLVTSHGAGMAVPDWPNTYGYNMFFFPISKWIGGIFYEHTHRLVASGVGLLVTILALWLHGYRARPLVKWGGASFIWLGLMAIWLVPKYRLEGALAILVGAVAFVAGFNWPGCDPAARWLRRLGTIAFVLVVIQGLLGGFRVTQMNNQLGIVHATLAQVFFALIAGICLFLTEYWKSVARRSADSGRLGDRLGRGSVPVAGMKLWCVTLTALILVQLVLGATMRHQHAGLAIPDFPLAYGKIWPATDGKSIDWYNQSRIESEGFEPITAFQVWLQMAHRIVGYVIVLWGIVLARVATRRLGWRNDLTRWVVGWATLLVAQALLGATTIWTEKSADIATLHVAVGTLSLALGGVICLIAWRVADDSSEGGLHVRVPSIESRTVWADKHEL